MTYDHSADRPAGGGRRISLRKVAWGMVLGALLGMVLAIGVAIWLNRGQPPLMTPADLDAAEARWSRRGVRNYDLDLDASLGLQGRMHVEVREGKVGQVTFDGQPTKPQSWDYWSVRGLFDVMDIDRQRNAEAAKNPAGAQNAPVFQQAIFDADYGLPLEYRRTETATGQIGGWRVTRFRPLP